MSKIANEVPITEPFDIVGAYCDIIKFLSKDDKNKIDRIVGFEKRKYEKSTQYFSDVDINKIHLECSIRDGKTKVTGDLHIRDKEIKEDKKGYLKIDNGGLPEEPEVTGRVSEILNFLRGRDQS